MPEIIRVLSLSTAHLAETVAKELDTYKPFAADHEDHWLGLVLVAPWFGYGWWIYIPEDEATWSEVPPCLGAAFRYAHKLGTTFIKFDSDGDKVDALQVHDW